MSKTSYHHNRDTEYCHCLRVSPVMFQNSFPQHHTWCSHHSPRLPSRQTWICSLPYSFSFSCSRIFFKGMYSLWMASFTPFKCFVKPHVVTWTQFVSLHCGVLSHHRHRTRFAIHSLFDGHLCFFPSSVWLFWIKPPGNLCPRLFYNTFFLSFLFE